MKDPVIVLCWHTVWSAHGCAQFTCTSISLICQHLNKSNKEQKERVNHNKNLTTSAVHCTVDGSQAHKKLNYTHISKQTLLNVLLPCGCSFTLKRLNGDTYLNNLLPGTIPLIHTDVLKMQASSTISVTIKHGSLRLQIFVESQAVYNTLCYCTCALPYNQQHNTSFERWIANWNFYVHHQTNINIFLHK